MPPLRTDPSKSFNRAVGARLRTARTARQVSQKQLARSSSLRFESISKYEGGVHPPTLRSAHTMAQVLGVPLDCLAPEIVFTEEADRLLYAVFRQIWFTPLQTRHVLATMLSCCIKFQETTPLSWGRLAGGHHASSER